VAVKRIAAILVSITVLVIGTLIVGPRFIPADTARDRITEQIEQWIGRSVAFGGEPDISLFPRPRIRLENVRIDGADGELFVEAEELTGTFRYLPLLWGEIEIETFELVRPTIALRVDNEGRPNWNIGGTVGDRIADAFSEPDGDVPVAVSEVVLGGLTIVDGTVTFDRPGAGRATISEVALDLHWPSTASAVTATGSLLWEGERIEISAALSEPLELFAARDSPVRFTVSGRPIRVEFDGFVDRNGLVFALDGMASVTTGSLRRVIDWMGTPMADGPTLAGAAFAGRANWSWPVLAFTNAEMRLDGNVANGAVSIDFGGERTRIVGTLAFEALDLSPYAYAFRADVQAEGAWKEAPIDLPVLADIDWDIRLSSDRLILGATRVEGFAASAIVSDGVVDLRMAEAEFYGGRVQASLSGALDGRMLSAEAALSLTNVNLMPALLDVLGMPTLAGRANATMAVRSAGDSWGELVHGLTGTLRASIANGSFRGIDLAAAAAIEAPGVDDVVTPSGETTFALLSADLSFYGGQLIADRLTASGPGFDLAFTGWGSLTSPVVNGVGVVWLNLPGGESGALPFAVTGGWLDPLFIDDPGAAAFVRRPVAAE
jgi:AsmA protein